MIKSISFSRALLLPQDCIVESFRAVSQFFTSNDLFAVITSRCNFGPLLYDTD